jgi:hypothetical protein
VNVKLRRPSIGALANATWEFINHALAFRSDDKRSASVTKPEQEFRQFTKDFRKSMSAVIERLDHLIELCADTPTDPATPAPEAPADPQEPLPFASGGNTHGAKPQIYPLTNRSPDQ